MALAAVVPIANVDHLALLKEAAPSKVNNYIFYNQINNSHTFIEF